MDTCLFCKMATKEIPVEYIYEDDNIFVINDIHPQAPTHLLAIPKSHYAGIHLVPDGAAPLFQHLLHAINQVVSTLKIAENGYRLVLNSGETAGQSVHHIHVHILSGRQFHWPPG